MVWISGIKIPNWIFRIIGIAVILLAMILIVSYLTQFAPALSEGISTPEAQAAGWALLLTLLTVTFGIASIIFIALYKSGLDTSNDR